MMGAPRYSAGSQGFHRLAGRIDQVPAGDHDRRPGAACDRRRSLERESPRDLLGLGREEIGLIHLSQSQLGAGQQPVAVRLVERDRRKAGAPSGEISCSRQRLASPISRSASARTALEESRGRIALTPTLGAPLAEPDGGVQVP